MVEQIICKNEKCWNIIPASKNSGRPREYCSERCRKRRNARLHYQRQVKGTPFEGLRTVTELGYPKVNRKKSQSTKEARKRLREHGENCTAMGEYCQGKLHDAYNTKKLCLVRAVFTEDWEELMAQDEGKSFERTVTTEDGMWLDDFNDMMEKHGDEIRQQQKQQEEALAAFIAAGGQRPPS